MTLAPPSTSIDARRMGLTKKEAVRCLKRYVAREVYGLLPHEKLGLDNPLEHRTGRPWDAVVNAQMGQLAIDPKSMIL